MPISSPQITRMLGFFASPATGILLDSRLAVTVKLFLAQTLRVRATHRSEGLVQSSRIDTRSGWLATDLTTDTNP